MTLRGHNTITATGRATRTRVERRFGRGASFGINTCPNTPTRSAMQLEGLGISRLQSSQRQTLNNSLSMR